MRFSVHVHDYEVPGLIRGLLEITGTGPWQKRLAWLRKERDDNPFMQDWLHERCAIKYAVGEYLSNSPELFVADSAEKYEMVAFAAAIVRCYQRLSGKGQCRLAGMLFDGLKEDKGVLSVQHELTTAIHLMSRGFDVEFHDLEHGGVDYIARRQGAELEVECKVFSADLGRKIHRRRVATLFKALEPVVSTAYRAATRGLMVVVTLPEGLTPAPEQHAAIVRAVSQGLVAGAAGVQAPTCTVRLLDFDVARSPFRHNSPNVDLAAVGDFVRSSTAVEHPHVMNLFSPKGRAVVLVVHSAKPDRVLEGMRRQLRDAALGQFSRGRPGLLSVQLHDLSDDQLFELGSADSTLRQHATGLQVMTSELLQSPSRAHIHAVAYVARGATPSQDWLSVRRSASHAYFIRNANHPQYADARLEVFGAV